MILELKTLFRSNLRQITPEIIKSIEKSIFEHQFLNQTSSAVFNVFFDELIQIVNFPRHTT